MNTRKSELTIYITHPLMYSMKKGGMILGKQRKQADLRTLEQHKEEQLEKDRHAIITKANAMIQKTRYSLSLQEQKIVLFAMSKIQPTDTFLTEYAFSIKEFCDICGITATNYDGIKETFLRLKKKAFWLTIDDRGTESGVDWFSTVRINKRSGIVKLKFHEDLHPFLLELTKNFTSFTIYPTLVMKSRYSIRLYELLKSYSNLSEWVFDLNNLKRKLDAEKYQRYADFRRYVLDVSQREINQYTELDISYQPIKDNSRQYNKIRFFINTKAPFLALHAEKEVSKELDNVDQLSKEVCEIK